jgi:ATP-dependent Clp protease ATP-binding subunit ClpB
VVDIQLQTLKKRLAERNIQIEVTDRAKAKLAEEGYDPVLGARPLKRVIQRRIQNVLALKILRGEFKEGDRVLVDVGPNGELEFSHQPTAEAQPESI